MDYRNGVGWPGNLAQDLERHPATEARLLGPAWAVVALLLVPLLLGAMTGCDNSTPACQPTPASTPTLSATSRLILGQWVINDGHLAKSQIKLGEKVEFRPDGTFLWEANVGQYSIFRDQVITLKRSAVGESFEYDFTVSEGILVMSRGTNCGKEDRYVLERVE